MQQQANAIAGPAQLAIPTPQPVTLRRGSLRWALDSMEDSVLTDSHRETTLKQFYNFNPTQMGQGLAHLNEMLVNHGNRGGTGPILLLFNTQNNLELACAIAEVPLAMRDQLGRTAKHRTHPHIICFGHRTSDSQLPAALPIKLAEFFRSRRGKLADFQSASQADPATITAAPLWAQPMLQSSSLSQWSPSLGEPGLARSLMESMEWMAVALAHGDSRTFPSS